MLSQTRGDRFVPFGLCRAIELVCAFQPEITGAYCQRFAHPCSRVVEEQQQSVIAFAVPGPLIDGSYYGARFFRFQICGGPSECFFVADGKNTPILTRSRYVLPQ